MKYNLQFFGGRGASAGTGSGNIIAFSRKEKSRQSSNNALDFRGEAERVDKLESAISKTNGMKAMTNLSLSLKREEQHLTTLINQVDSGKEDGDKNTLITLRRRVRQAQSRLKSKRGM